MGYKERYIKKLKAFLNNDAICKENRELYKAFFEKEEYILKRKRGAHDLDESNYKTLNYYITRLSNVNFWFKNKPLKSITIADMKRVYDGLEDGTIRKKHGKGAKFSDRKSYYSKIFKSTLFQMIGKTDIAREVLSYGSYAEKKPVRFISEDTFRQLVDLARKPQYKALLWCCFDFGENINAILQLEKRDFTRQQDKDTGQTEYVVNLRPEYLKRSRRPRSLLTNYKETVHYLDMILPDLKDHDKVFSMAYFVAANYLISIVKMGKFKCMPNGEPVTFKDLRSSMACDLLSKDWSRDEVNSRLGHAPSSDEIDRYINYLAIDGKKPQRKVYQSNLAKIEAELEKSKQKEKLYQLRVDSLKDELERQSKEMADFKKKLLLIEKFEKVYGKK